MATRKTPASPLVWMYTYKFEGTTAAHAFTTHQACKDSCDRSRRLAHDMGYSDISEPAPVVVLAS